MFKDKRKFIRVIVLAMVLCMAAAFSGCSDKDDTPVQFTGGKQCRLARINFKDYGSVSFRLYKDEEPELVEKFIEACKNGTYNGMELQNVIEDYVLIAGCDPLDPDYDASTSIRESCTRLGVPFVHQAPEPTCVTHRHFRS